jgi:hypothetical protein
MAINSLYPSFVQIHYHSGWGKHVQTIPTRQWIAPSGGFPYGSYTSWGAGAVGAGDMIGDFVDKVAVIADAHIAWDFAIIFNYPGVPPALPNPVAIVPLTQVGAVTHTDAAIALQQTYTMYDSAFGTFKLVLLDMDATFTLFPKGYADLDADHQAVINQIADNTQAWSSRLGNIPLTLRSAISKPNDKLRKEYSLS